MASRSTLRIRLVNQDNEQGTTSSGPVSGPVELLGNAASEVQEERGVADV